MPESVRFCIEAVADDESLGMDSAFVTDTLDGAVVSPAILLHHIIFDVVVVALIRKDTHFGGCCRPWIES